MSPSRGAFLSAMISIFLLLLLAACGGAPQSTASSTGNTNGGKAIEVVAAENFWGSIASQVGGSHVHVTSLVVDPNAGPHQHPVTAQDARTVASAQYVIVNG